MFGNYDQMPGFGGAASLARLDALAREETVLRRRLLFRLLRRFDFAAPVHRGEMITEPVPRGLIAAEYRAAAAAGSARPHA
ncbi:hypothetical protein ACUXV3_18080 [Roseobacteraceae bacterium NS-SX3]